MGFMADDLEQEHLKRELHREGHRIEKGRECGQAMTRLSGKAREKCFGFIAY
jgi:hypothetical protein